MPNPENSIKVSQAYHRFKTRINYFNDDIELVDVFCSTEFLERVASPVQSNSPIIGISDIHTSLLRRSNTDGTRNQISNHLRATVFSSYIKDMYEEVMCYMKKILYDASKKSINPDILIGDLKIEVNIKDILRCGNWDNLLRKITDEVFKKIEGKRSTLEIFTRINKRLRINMDNSKINAAIQYLNIRHQLVHNDGFIPDEMKQLNGVKCTPKGRIKLTLNLLYIFKEVVTSTIREIDKKIVSADLLLIEDLHPTECHSSTPGA